MSRIKYKGDEILYTSMSRNTKANSKSEALNPKQIQINQIQNPKQNNLIFEHPRKSNLTSFRRFSGEFRV